MSVDKIQYTCNLCGEPCALGTSRETYDGQLAQGGLLDAKVTGGYESTPGNGSGALDDMTRYGFSLCEFCLDWLFQQFKIPVKTDDYMTDDQFLPPAEQKPLPAWKSAAQRVEEDDWRRFKEEFRIESTRRALLRKIQS
jgi:hypothetical protein